MTRWLGGFALVCAAVAVVCLPSARAEKVNGWAVKTPDEGTPPAIRYDSDGGPEGDGGWVVEAKTETDRPGVLRKVVPVKGGRFYRFRGLYRLSGDAVGRDHAIPNVAWINRDGPNPTVSPDLIMNPNKTPSVDSYRAPDVYPRDRRVTSSGWTVVEGTYQAPEQATHARLELRFRGRPGMVLRWANVTWEPTAPDHRRVGLAAVHYTPDGPTPEANRKQFVPLVNKAGQKGADLVVLPEYATYRGTGGSYADVAEAVPDGPTTRFFADLAEKETLYIVAGLIERAADGDLHNTAILVGPDGYVGKYRKVVPTGNERNGGLVPGTEYPVFETEIGTLGMMICWDVHFPEVARNLANKGAEIIALPIWGGDPKLARARAIENQVYLVTSTYTSPEENWMKTAVWDLGGRRVDTATSQGEVAYQEVDLGEEKYWHGFGHFRGRIFRERPPAGTGRHRHGGR